MVHGTDKWIREGPPRTRHETIEVWKVPLTVTSFLNYNKMVEKNNTDLFSSSNFVLMLNGPSVSVMKHKVIFLFVLLDQSFLTHSYSI